MGGGNARRRNTTSHQKSRTTRLKSAGNGIQTQLSFSKKKKVFISFHMEDEPQIKLFRHQAKNSKFGVEFDDYSVKKPFDNRWKSKCESRINQSPVTIVMIGPETYKRPAVLWEINKAYELGKKVIGVKIYRNRNDPVPGPLLRNNTKIMNWDLDKIQKEINK